MVKVNFFDTAMLIYASTFECVVFFFYDCASVTAHAVSQAIFGGDFELRLAA